MPGTPVTRWGVRPRADLIVASRYLVSVRAMLGAERASHATQMKWWKTCDRTDGTIPVMIVRGTMGMTIKGWSAWIDLNHLLDRTPNSASRCACTSRTS